MCLAGFGPVLVCLFSINVHVLCTNPILLCVEVFSEEINGFFGVSFFNMGEDGPVGTDIFFIPFGFFRDFKETDDSDLKIEILHDLRDEKFAMSDRVSYETDGHSPNRKTR